MTQFSDRPSRAIAAAVKAVLFRLALTAARPRGTVDGPEDRRDM